MNVSLLTTPINIECLDILKDLIIDQTYKNISEWIIVNSQGWKAPEDFNIPIKYVDLSNNYYFEGDIIISLKDDVYYTSTSIQYIVDSFKDSRIQKVLCENALIYDYTFCKLFRENTKDTIELLAWKKGSSKDSTKESFLDSDKILIKSSHNDRNEKINLLGSYHKINKLYTIINETINIDNIYFERYKQIFYKSKKSDYDIVYLAGAFSIKWDPKNKSLGGSEQAIVALSNSWAKMGKKVAVYGEISDEKINDVDYFHWSKFRYEDNYDTIILWRLFGLWTGASFNLKANKIYLDVHDNFFSTFLEKWNMYGKVVNKIFFKSDYHKDQFEIATKQILSKDKYAIIPNGVRVESFLVNKDNMKRDPYRFCYCSCYTRGLSEILQYVWPVIYHYEPRAELHVYYGMDNIKDKNKKNLFEQLLTQPGVMDHGRQSMNLIIREKYMSSFHLYITNTPDEIDCISIRESLVTGCIPLISNFGVFKSREGIHFELKDEIECYQNIGAKILEILEQNDKLDMYRDKIKKSPLIISWDNIAKKWLN
jgi:hypothetical protein